MTFTKRYWYEVEEDSWAILNPSHADKHDGHPASSCNPGYTCSFTYASAGGSIVNSYPQIGVLITSSDNIAFNANLMKESRIYGSVACPIDLTIYNFLPAVDNGAP